MLQLLVVFANSAFMNKKFGICFVSYKMQISFFGSVANFWYLVQMYLFVADIFFENCEISHFGVENLVFSI